MLLPSIFRQDVKNIRSYAYLVIKQIALQMHNTPLE